MKVISKILVLFFACTYSLVATSQVVDGYKRNFKFGVGLNTGLPLNDPYNFNLGADVRLQYNISKAYSLCFTTGYNNLFVSDDAPNFGFVPVKVGYKTFLFKNEFYVMGEIGAVFSVSKDYDNNSMIFCPSVGFATKIVDISLRYEFLKDFPIVRDGIADNGLANLMVRFAYGFDL